ncbi:peptidylprolyl isomerase [Algibacter miyuki]|uniref:Peptidyl-prolyl cis-trans isomerase n=1 Tax=Algibacter miyuki TaxID=1306933 RepID=A0ABV5H3A9_9FLAO|nr:peptidylprolyl isomerase [Algibacter miyuki]MDN3666397.1 peptidylprolyl isomerase [Algibacter miyuki]
MRLVLLLSFFFLFLNCEDKQSKKKNTTETELRKPVKKDSIVEVTDTFEKLDSRSAMEFFLEYDKHHKENKVRITTDLGSFDILLYNETKFHRSNFIFLTKKKYFVNTQFYRVIDDYMVQAGNSDDIEISKKRGEIGKYLLPPDTKRGFKHDRGVISMPSSAIDNPHKLASPYEFFIIQQHGGSHFLNGDYTVFGHVTRGMDVIDKIAAVDTGEGDWPLQNIYIRDCEIIE